MTSIDRTAAAPEERGSGWLGWVLAFSVLVFVITAASMALTGHPTAALVFMTCGVTLAAPSVQVWHAQPTRWKVPPEHR
jgi:hypothetical protein